MDTTTPSNTLKRLKGAAPARVNLLLLGASALAVVCGCVGTAQAAQKLTVLLSFANFEENMNNMDGQWPFSGLITDGGANLYGTTNIGGISNKGVVFELSPPMGGQTAWTETVLQSFDGVSGEYPSAPLIADSAGNFYGTTYEGGAHGGSVVFKLTP